MAKKTVTKVAAKTVKKAPAKAPAAKAPAAKAPAKAPAKPKVVAKAPSKPKAPAKAPAKPKVVAKAPAKPKTTAKAPAKGEPRAVKSNYTTMKVADLREILEQRGLDTTGLRPVLIARLQADDAANVAMDEEVEEEEEEEEVEEEEEEEVEEEAEPEEEEPEEEKPAPAKGKKVVAKAPAKGKKAAPVKKVPAPKPAPKTTAKATKVVEKEALKLVVPKNITNNLYKIDAKTLAAIIVKSFNEHQGEMFESLFDELEDYAALNSMGQKYLPEAEEPKPKANPERKKMVSEFNETYGGYTNPEGTFLIHPVTQEIFAKIVDGAVRTLEESDVEGIVNMRINRLDGELPSLETVEAYLDESLEIHNKSKPVDIPKLLKKDEKKDPPKKEEKKDVPKVQKKEEPKVEKKETKKETEKEVKEAEKDEETEEAEEEEGVEEGKDDGEEVVIEDEEENEDEDVVDQVNKEEKELIKPAPQITEEIFAKFLQAFNSGIPKTDHVAIAKKSGLDVEVAQEILLQYRFFSDKYPQAVAAAAMARRPQPPPKPAFGASKSQVKPKTGQTRLIK